MKTNNFTKGTMVLGAAMMLTALLISSCTNTNGKDKDFEKSLMPVEAEGFVQAELPYAFDALEPYIDQQTMELHYGKHHAGYTSKFNAALAEEGITERDLNKIFANVSQYGAGIRNNGGGYYNHSLFWNFLSPDGGGEPSGELLKAIEKDFGSFDAFKELFSKAAASQFGSGWAWLIVDESGNLQVTSTANQDNPLMDVVDVKGAPILNLDVWEHAYYLFYQNRRTEYIGNFWNLVNWETVDKLYKAAK
jgi:superoxide dismutase, Fe-Mn family